MVIDGLIYFKHSKTRYSELLLFNAVEPIRGEAERQYSTVLIGISHPIIWCGNRVNTWA